MTTVKVDGWSLQFFENSDNRICLLTASLEEHELARPPLQASTHEDGNVLEEDREHPVDLGSRYHDRLGFDRRFEKVVCLVERLEWVHFSHCPRSAV